jgi:membrane-associated phospholipid phosphatase
MMLVCLVIGDGCINWSFKVLVNRPRPMEVLPHLRVVTVHGVSESQAVPPENVKSGRSFTSGHASNNLALAIVGTAIFGRAAWFLFPWALLVSYARVYGANHYPSDIVGSWIVALFYTYYILKGTDYLWRVYAPRKLPKLYEKHPVLFPGLFP